MTAVDAEIESYGLVDCNLRAYPPQDELTARLPDRFRSRGAAYPTGNFSSRSQAQFDQSNAEGVVRSYETVASEYLDPFGVDTAVITGGIANLRAGVMPDFRYAQALTRAFNTWVSEEWLEKDDRIVGSISVAPTSPEQAANEIYDRATDPNFVQVLVGGASQIPLGQRKYWPIYQAATDVDMPIAIQTGAEGYGIAYPNTGPGYPTTQYEATTVAPCNVMGQLLNLILEGVFVEFPDLEVVLTNGGYGWLPAFLWRVDKNWKGLMDDVPWLDKPPSEYFYEHVRVTSHPTFEGSSEDVIRNNLEMIRAEDVLMFSSNYPHPNHFPQTGDIPDIPEDQLRDILVNTASDLYGF